MATRRYDILKEGAIASIVVFILVIGLAAVLSSPDEHLLRLLVGLKLLLLILWELLLTNL